MGKFRLSMLFRLMLALLLVLFAIMLTYDSVIQQPPPPVYRQLNSRAATLSAQDFLRLSAVNLNTATKQELMDLPGIGEKLAERILSYRAAHGSFDNMEELKNIKGFGEKTVRRICEYAYIQ